MSGIVDNQIIQLKNGEWIHGPMKWIVIILGQKHKLRYLKDLIQKEHKNLNIIVVLLTNQMI